jgi:hypothetical protein
MFNLTKTTQKNYTLFIISVLIIIKAGFGFRKKCRG